jgi:hypothetical protein
VSQAGNSSALAAHPAVVKSLVLLSGETFAEGLQQITASIVGADYQWSGDVKSAIRPTPTAISRTRISQRNSMAAAAAYGLNAGALTVVSRPAIATILVP